MTKLIQRHEAAKMIGVTRQTIQNWIEKGIIKSKRIGKAIYVSTDAIKVLAPDINGVEESRQILQNTKNEIDRLLKDRQQLLHDLKVELRILPLCAESIVRKEFYLSLIEMIGDNQEITARESGILRDIMEGYTMEEISKSLGLTCERVRQLAYKAIRKMAHLTNLRALEQENHELKNEFNAMQSHIQPLHQRIAELEKQHGLNEQCNDYMAEQIYQFLIRPVTDFPFSTRCLNAISYQGIKTIGDLAKKKKTELTLTRNIGKKTINEITEFLEKNGLSFGFDTDKYIEIHFNLTK